jgi:hypothetical protein
VKNYLLIGLLMFSLITNAQSNISPNIFIITTDGFRWQEVFGGADPQLLSNPNLVADTAACNQMFGGTDPLERRKKLLPFFWQVIARKGQLAGNRQLNNKVNPIRVTRKCSPAVLPQVSIPIGQSTAKCLLFWKLPIKKMYTKEK